jgi:hypothetical protein
MTHLINLMAHDLVVISGVQRFVLPRSGQVARVEQHVVEDTLLSVVGAENLVHGS